MVEDLRYDEFTYLNVGLHRLLNENKYVIDCWQSSPPGYRYILYSEISYLFKCNDINNKNIKIKTEEELRQFIIA